MAQKPIPYEAKITEVTVLLEMVFGAQEEEQTRKAEGVFCSFLRKLACLGRN